jgi:CO/xanthine dehydrogenase Mo-binding subunit
MSTVIGASVPRTDGVSKVTGEAVYAVDYELPGMLRARLLRSPVAAGVITRLDTSKARELPGVHGVFTAEDAPSTRAGWVLREQRLFDGELLRYEGEPIAGVVADTREQATAALDAIELEIDELEPIADPTAAVAPGARLVHPEWESYAPAGPDDHPRRENVAAELLHDADPEAFEQAFSSAHAIVEDEYTVPRQYQAYLEPKSAVASYREGRYTVHTAHQYPFNIRDRLAQFLDVRPSAIRVIGHHIGGAFGGKLDAGLEHYAALFARLCGRPVKLVNSREEDILTCPSRSNAIIRIRTALAADGTILARELIELIDNGAYSGETPWLTSIPMHVLGQVYRPGITRVKSTLAYTNTAPTGAFRGVSGAPLYFAVEQHMDSCAGALGMDRREFRMRNLIGEPYTTLNGQTLEDSALLGEAFTRVEERAPWTERAAGESSDGKLRGSGLAAVTWLTSPAPGSATLKLNEDGTLGLITAATDNGSGAVTMGITQIAADSLGLQPEDVVLLMPDTDAASYDAGSQGSRTTQLAGRATAIAGAELKEKLLAFASSLLEADIADLELEEGHVVVTGAAKRRIPLAQAAAAATFSGGPLTGTGSYATPIPDFNPGCASGMLFPVFPTPSYHVHYAEVEVDLVTGNVSVTRYVVAQEVGRAINPAGVRGQIQGGVVQGIGYALYESLESENGKYRERSLETYRLPLACDVPEVEIILMEHPGDEGPLGAKGVAEPPLVPVAAAIASAVGEAIGRPITRLPIRPDDVLAALSP